MIKGGLAPRIKHFDIPVFHHIGNLVTSNKYICNTSPRPRIFWYQDGRLRDLYIMHIAYYYTIYHSRYTRFIHE